MKDNGFALSRRTVLAALATAGVVTHAPAPAAGAVTPVVRKSPPSPVPAHNSLIGVV